MTNKISAAFTSRVALSAFALVSLSVGSAALAHPPVAVPDSYRMAAIVDDAHGEELVSGDFTQVITELAEDAADPRADFAVSNNLCVAYVMAKDATNALDFCERAVSASKTRLRVANTFGRRAINLNKAVALTNRGVVLAVTGDLAAAKADFEEAISLRINLREPVENLRKLEASQTAALAAL